MNGLEFATEIWEAQTVHGNLTDFHFFFSTNNSNLFENNYCYFI